MGNLIRDKFINRNFLLLFLGRLTSRIGDSIYTFAAIWFVIDITGSAVYSGLLAAVGLIPVVIFMPFAGVIADRFNRKNIIVITDLISGITLLGMFFLIDGNGANMGLLYVTALILGTCSGIFSPASMTMIPEVVEKKDLKKANSLMSITSNFSFLIGVLFAGALYSTIGLKVIFLLNGISFLISAFSEKLITLKKTSSFEGDLKVKTVMRDMKEAFDYVRGKKVIFTMFSVFIFINLILAPLQSVYLPFIYNQMFKCHSIYLALTQVAFGTGAVLGAVLMPKIKQDNNTLMINALLEESVCTVLIAAPLIPFIFMGMLLSVKIAFYVIVAFCYGIGFVITNICISITCHSDIDSKYMGRVSALLSTFSTIAMPIGYLLGGIVAEYIPMYIVILVTSVVMGMLVIKLKNNIKEYDLVDNKGLEDIM